MHHLLHFLNWNINNVLGHTNSIFDNVGFNEVFAFEILGFDVTQFSLVLKISPRMQSRLSASGPTLRTFHNN